MRRNFLLMAMLFHLGISAQVTPAFQPPLMGWSSWNTYRVNINDSLICRQADALVGHGLKDVGYNYINIDDGFFGYRNEEGVMQTHPQRFPNGLKGVAHYIHSLGLKAGIYSDAGANTCGSIWDNDKNGIGAGMYGHEYQDATLYFKDWGFDFIKIDFCGAGQELDLEERRRYTEIREAIDKAGFGHVSLNICRWAFPGTWARDIARSWRISSDIAPNWGSVKHIIGKNLYLSAYAGGGHYNDMDMLEIGRGLSAEEEEVHFGMWCIMSSPLLIGCDLTTIPSSSLALLKNRELIAVNQDPLGLQAYVVQHEGGGYVLVKDIEQRRGKARAVAFYNPSDQEVSFSVPLSLLEMQGKVKVRDLVKRENLGVVSGTLHRKLNPHSVFIAKIEGEQRIEPDRYEAEWAYLPLYNDLGKSTKSIMYAPHKAASGGMVVSFLGGSRENCAIWEEVYSEEGGEYEMTIDYLPKAGRHLEVTVNDQPTIILKGNQKVDDLTAISSRKIKIMLMPGNNRISMGNPYAWAPDVDGFSLRKSF